MGTLLERPLVKNNFQTKFPQILKAVDSELDAVKRLYDHQMSSVQASSGQVNKNMPKVAGLLRWSQELTERVQTMMEKFNALNHGYD